MFVIGNISDSPIVNNATKMFTGSKRIYGVSFDESGIPTRLYDAVGLVFEPSSTTIAGQDDFINTDRGKSPFHIRECLTQYNSETGKQEVLCYEGESGYASYRDNENYNVMIEFPRFWYKRPSKYEWEVSAYPIQGFSPSPLHYRNGIMHDYAYVSKYMMNSAFMSRPGQVGVVGSTRDNVRNGFKNLGMYCMDYAGWCAINILMLVKYGTLNIQNLVGYGWSNTSAKANTGGADGVLGKDGYAAEDKMSNGQIVAMGIEDYWGNCWKWAEGCFRVGNIMYVNTNIEDITKNATADDHPGYSEFPLNPDNNYTGFGWIDDFYYDAQFPWVFVPEFTTHTTTPNYPTDPGLRISDGYWHNTTTTLCICIVGGYYKNGYANGPFAVSLAVFGTLPLLNTTAHSFFLS